MHTNVATVEISDNMISNSTTESQDNNLPESRPFKYDNPSAVSPADQSVISTTSSPSNHQNSPPKPPRLHSISDLETPGELITADQPLTDSTELSAQPYAIVDASAFKSPPKDSAQNAKGNKKSNYRKDSKPPIPKSQPPKKIGSSDNTTGTSQVCL